MNKFERQGRQQADRQTLPEATGDEFARLPVEIVDIIDAAPIAPRPPLLPGEIRTILMSLHGESEISTLATRAIRLDAGAVVADTHTGANFRSILAFANA